MPSRVSGARTAGGNFLLWRRPVAAAAAAALLSGCGLVGGPRTVQENVPDIMTVTSQQLSRGAMRNAFTCHGARSTSPPLRWSGAPTGTKSLAVVVDDSAAPITPYIYWIVFDIGVQRTSIPEGSIPAGARQAENSAGVAGYTPPCPTNHDHSYRFTVYALDSALRLRNGVSEKTAWTAIAHAAIARGRLTTVAKP